MSSESGARQVDDPGVDRTLDESGTVLGERYRLLRPLGEGGAGIVYAATDERIGAEVAIKVVRGSARRDEITLARFHREARAAGKLGHPNIVRVTDFGTSSTGSPYVVMERLDGETLEARILRSGKLDPATATDVHVQLADALAAAHAAGVLHRDVKPANVFLTQLATGKALVKLLDFGLAELYQEPASVRLTERGLLVGSLAYLSPERILGGAADEQSDVYGIGVSLYESLGGALPFAAPNPMMVRARILAGEIAPLADVPHALTEVVRLCLERAPAERLRTAAEVRRRLLVAERAPVATVAASTQSEPATTPLVVAPRRAAWPWITGLATVLALAIAAAAASSADRAPVRSTVVPTTPVPTLPPPPSLAPALVPALVPSPAPPLAPAPALVPSPAPSPAPSRPPRTRPAPRVPASTAPRTSAPSAPEVEAAPSRFDHIQEPDWGAPIPR